MIARIWNGRTNAEHYETYTAFMNERAVPDYKGTEGFVKLSFLRKVEGDIAYFKLVTYWESMEVIKNFAGDDYSKAKYYSEDKKYLLEFEEHVQHYEVFADESIDED